LSALRKKGVKVKGKTLVEKMFGAVLPKGAGRLKLSKMHMDGMGTSMMKGIMKKKKVASLPELIDTAGQLGVNIRACKMSMGVMGLRREEFLDSVKSAA
jgi:peroxiredoxin family protein